MSHATMGARKSACLHGRRIMILKEIKQNEEKSMALIAALVVAVGGFAAVATTGCSPKEQNGANTEETLNTPEPEALYEAVKAAYGEKYLPTMRLSDEEIEGYFGISKDLYETAIASV